MAEKQPPITSSSSGGYPIEIFPKEFDHKFLCNHCSKILKDPVQSYCGHRFCKTCIESVVSAGEQVQCQSCIREGVDDDEYSMLTANKVFPDNAVKREMSKMESHCINVGCNWKGPFKNYEEHTKNCPESRTRCEHCGNEQKRKVSGRRSAERSLHIQPTDSDSFNWVDVEMAKHSIQMMLIYFQFREQQMRDAIIKVKRNGRSLNYINILEAIRHPGDPLINNLMSSGNYTYLDVMYFLHHYRMTHNDNNPTEQEFHEAYRIKKGTGIEQLVLDKESMAQDICRLHERYQESLRIEHENYDNLLARYNAKQCALVNSQRQLGDAQQLAQRALKAEEEKLQFAQRAKAAEDEKRQLAQRAKAAEDEKRQLAQRAKAAEDEKRQLAQRAKAAEDEKRQLAQRAKAAENEKRQLAQRAKAAEDEKRQLAQRAKAAEDEKRQLAKQAEKEKLQLEDEKRHLAQQAKAAEDEKRELAQQLKQLMDTLKVQ